MPENQEQESLRWQYGRIGPLLELKPEGTARPVVFLAHRYPEDKQFIVENLALQGTRQAW